MTDNPIRLRPARPESGDGEAFARYLDQAAEGFFGFWLGQRNVEIVARAFEAVGHDLSFEHATFAECDGEIVGMVSGFTAEQHRLSSLEPLERAAGSARLRMAVIGTLCAPMLRILDTVADGDFYLQAVAVDESMRGRGVGSLLIDSIEERGQASGARRLVLDVSGNNDGARRLYERRGMCVESRWPKRFRVPGVSFLRMIKEL